MKNKTIYEKIKELSFEEMLVFIRELSSDCAPPHWACMGDCKECISMYLQSEYKEDVTYIYVLPDEEIKTSFHTTVKRSLYDDSVKLANLEFAKLYPHVKYALVLRKDYVKASDGTAVFDSIYKVD